MSLPGMTRETIDGFVRELGQMRSEKKAANYIKDFLIKASGGGEELRALVESRASSKSGSAIQIPKVTPRNPDKQSPDGIGGFSAEDATRAIGL
jgi:exportin-5